MREETARALMDWIYTVPIQSDRENTARSKLLCHLLEEIWIPDCNDPDAKPPQPQPPSSFNEWP